MFKNPNGDSTDSTEHMRMQLLSTLKPYCILLSLVPAVLTTQENGLALRRLKSALSCDDSPLHVFKYILPFLAMIGSEDLCSGTCRSASIVLLDT
jgi:hypothetical protein